jgi:hypothetical protein
MVIIIVTECVDGAGHSLGVVSADRAFRADRVAVAVVVAMSIDAATLGDDT